MATRSRPFGTLLLLLLVLSAGALVLVRNLGTASFYGDEAIYAQIAHESAEGDWLPPRFNGHVHLDKPPLRPLVSAALFRVFGESELVARVPDVLCTLGLLAVVFIQGARFFGPWCAALAALLPLTAGSFVFQHGMRDAVIEAMVVLLSTVMLLSWLRSLEGLGRRWILVTGVCAALLGLVKNPLGVVFAAVLVIQALVESRLVRPAGRPAAGIGWVLVAAVVAWGSWVAYMQWLTGGGYLSFLYVDLVVRSGRGIDPTHLRSWTFYARCVLGDFGWWLVLAGPAAWGALRHLRGRGDEADRARFHLAAWCGLILAGFSIPVSKNPWYIYPAYPALALFLASGARLAAEAVRRLPRTVGPALSAALAATLAIAMAVGLDGAWRRAGADTLVLDADRFAAAYRRLDGAELDVDLEALRRAGDFREWNWYYLSSLPGVRMGSTGDPQPASAGCHFIATPEPDAYRRPPWRWRMKVHDIDPREAPLWIVGTCEVDLLAVESPHAGPAF